MPITIDNPQLEATLQAYADAANLSPEAFTEQLLLDSLEDSPEEAADLRAAIEEGLADVDAGRTRPAEEVFAELRAQYGLPR